jgi:hypothetical protein
LPCASACKPYGLLSSDGRRGLPKCAGQSGQASPCRARERAWTEVSGFAAVLLFTLGPWLSGYGKVGAHGEIRHGDLTVGAADPGTMGWPGCPARLQGQALV